MIFVIKLIFERLKKKIDIKWSSKRIEDMISKFWIFFYIIVNVTVTRQFLQLAELSNVLNDQCAKVVFNLLCFESSSWQEYSMIKKFCEYFVKLFFCSRLEHELSFQISIFIRCELDIYYRAAWRQLHKDWLFITNEAITKHINIIHNSYTRNITLIASFKIVINEHDSLKNSSILKTMIKQSQSLDCFIHANEKQLFNLLTIYVRICEFKIFRDFIESWNENECHELLYFDR
jgi:hypothetical protein